MLQQLPPLLLLLLLGLNLARESSALDCSRLRQVLAESMRCNRVARLHAAAVLPHRRLCDFRLQLLQDGRVVDIDDRQLLLHIASISKGMFCSALPNVQQFLRSSRGDSFDLYTTPIEEFLGKDFWYLNHLRTETVTLQDLVSHNTGLPGYNSMNVLGDMRTKEEIVRRTGQLRATGDFRGSFMYNNLAYTVAEFTVERLLAANFTEFMRRFLWRPLGMDSTVGVSELGPGSPMYRILHYAEAAGGIVTSLDDMVKYAQHHLAANYTSSEPRTPPFLSVNAFDTGFGRSIKRLVHPNVTGDLPLPDIESESYGYGWFRNRYRDHLVVGHGGSAFTQFSQLDLYPKRQFAVFVHAHYNEAVQTAAQSLQATLISSYFADVQLYNKSFVTEDNVCRLFRNTDRLVTLQLKSLTPEEEEMSTGRFSSYGYGTVSVYRNDSSGRLNARYGVSLLELLPVEFRHRGERLEFLLRLLRPNDLVLRSEIVNVTNSHVTFNAASGPSSYATVRRQSGKVLLNGPLFEAAMDLEKGLDPSGWRRPKLCSGAAAACAEQPMLLSLLSLLLLGVRQLLQ